ncbi:Cytochrome P450 71A1 [Cocos nucifera]|uniref:Cytochrome P450 71A1 n=1 Tax=Cocos nucifera TaxID=13894 RepID=A0A8K0I387_COCNU|nr:Cytochrome P450 71A1 [Cocos nucifera]
MQSERRKLTSPPTPPRLPVLGNLHQLGGLSHRSLRSLSEKYGPVMLMYFGSVPTVIVSSAEAAQEVMKTRDLFFASRPKLSMADGLLYNSRDIAFSPYGEYWRQVRRISVLHLLSLRRVQSFRSVREEEVALMIDNIRCAASNMQPVNLSKLISTLTSDIICRVAFGRKCCEQEDSSNMFQEMIEEFGELLGTDICDFVDVLLSLDKDKDDDGMDVSLGKDSIKALILDMFAADTDTTYVVTEWARAEPVRHPKYMKRVQEEVRKAVGLKEKIEVELPDEMNHPKAVIKEGYDVPAGTRVMINAWAIARDPRSWERAEEFWPDRFMNSAVDFKGQDFKFIPFGAGRRGCPGIGFAIPTIELALANLLHHFDWALSDKMKEESLDMNESAGVASHKKVNLNLMAKPRILLSRNKLLRCILSFWQSTSYV